MAGAAAAHALCIGINSYPGTGRDLRGCVNDAHDWRKVLTARGYDVRLLLDGDATRAGILDAITCLVTAPGPRPRVLVYAGHGSFVPDADGDEPDGLDEVLCPSDVAAGHIVTDDEIVELFGRKRHGVPITFVSDSCHAGGLGLRRLDPGGAAPPKVRFLPPEVFLPASRTRTQVRSLTLRGRTRRRPALLFAACQPQEEAADAVSRARPGGAFTRAALRALRECPAGATYQDWYEQTLVHLPNRTTPQHPLLEGTATQRRRPALT